MRMKWIAALASDGTAYDEEIDMGEGYPDWPVGWDFPGPPWPPGWDQDLYDAWYAEHNPEETWLTYGTGLLFIPMGTHYDPSTEFIYIADLGNDRIVKTKIDGTGFDTLGSFGAGEGQFSSPSDVKYDPSTGFLYISDLNNSRIVKTKFDGSEWESLSNIPLIGNFSSYYIDYDPSTEFIYIADSTNYRIIKTKIDGTGADTFGAYGSGINQFTSMRGIKYNSSTGYLYISDLDDNERIVKTKMTGEGWTTLDVTGKGCWGIDYDPSTEFIYFSDNTNHVIIKTKIDGTEESIFGSQGTGENQFDMPAGLHFDFNSGYVFIANIGLNLNDSKIIKFSTSLFT